MSSRNNNSRNPFPTLILGAGANTPPASSPSNAITPTFAQAGTALAASNADGIEVPQYDLIDLPPNILRGRHTRLVCANYQYDACDGNTPSDEHREYLQLFKMAACILPMCPTEGKYLLIRQFRYPAWYNANKNQSTTLNDDGWIYEAIAGVIEPGDTPEATAVREAQEEGGISIDQNDIRKVHQCFMTPGITNEEMSIFLGIVNQTSPIGQTGLVDQGEHMRAKWMTADEIRRLHANGLIRDAKTLLALYAAKVL